MNIINIHFHLLIDKHWSINIYLLSISSERNKNLALRKQILSYLCLCWLRALVGVMYTKLPALKEQENIQRWLVIFLPVLKKFNFWWHEKLLLKVTQRKKMISCLNTIITVGFIHSFALTILLGSVDINRAAAYLLMLSDFGWNTWAFIKILKQNQPNTTLSKKIQLKSLKCLALKEFLEILVPAIFCLSFIAAYDGSCSNLIGNVKGSCWMFEEVHDLAERLSNIGIFMGIDLLRGLSLGFVLWHFRQLNIHYAYCSVVKKYGVFISIVWIHCYQFGNWV